MPLLPLDTRMDRQTGYNETEQAQREGPCVRSGCVEKVTADPCAEGAAHAEADLQKAEDETDLMPGKNVSDHRAIN